MSIPFETTLAFAFPLGTMPVRVTAVRIPDIEGHVDITFEMEREGFVMEPTSFSVRFLLSVDPCTLTPVALLK